jgi:hypothetical protein
MTPGQRSQRSRLANLDRWSRLDAAQRAAATAPARDALRRKYLAQADPDGTLPEAEREKLARQARQADIERMALAASRARTAATVARREARAVAFWDCPKCGSPAGVRCGKRRSGPIPSHPHAVRVALLDAAGQ